MPDPSITVDTRRDNRRQRSTVSVLEAVFDSYVDGVISRAARAIEEEARQVVSTPGSEDVRSSSGEAPYRQSGVGRSNIRATTNAAARRVNLGVLAPGWYMTFLDRQRNRPWMVQSVQNAIPRIQELAAEGATRVS